MKLIFSGISLSCRRLPNSVCRNCAGVKHPAEMEDSESGQPGSTGEEPYTLGIILQEMVENVRNWDIRITASDIDVIALEKAKEAVYAARSIRDVPPEYLERYFRQQADGNYKLSKNIRQMVNFEHLNLADKTEVRKRNGYDVIFCRNVLIYFDDLSRKNIVDHFYVALNPGGYIFLGSSESLGRINSAFKIKRVEGFLVYYKE